MWWPFARRTRRARDPFDLAFALLWLNKQDAWTLADACAGTQIWGSTGSGKTSGSLAAICDVFLRAGYGGLFFTCKPEDRRTYEKYIKRAGRESDLLLFGPTHDRRYNFIDAEIARSDSGSGLVENLVALLMIVADMADRQSRGGGGQENEGFWRKLSRQLLRNAIELLVMAKGSVTVSDLHALITSTPSSVQQVSSEAWRKSSFCFQCLVEANAKPKTPREAADFGHLLAFFNHEWASLSDKTKSVALSMVSSTVDIFARGIVKDLLSPPTSNIDMTMPQEGKIILVDMPVMAYGELAVFVQMTLKYCYQLAQNRRDISKNPRPTFMVCDESHLLTSLESDARFQTTARSTRTCVVYATQSISNYLALEGPQSEARVHSLLGNLQTQVFHQQTNTPTIQYAQELFGRELMFLSNGGTSRQQDDWMAAMIDPNAGVQSNSGFSETMEHQVQASAFHGLAKGGPPHWKVQGILYQGGKIFSANNKSFLPVTFLQDR